MLTSIPQKNAQYRYYRVFVAWVLWALVFVSARGEAGSITAELDRNHVALGEVAQLSVTISGSLKDDINIPQVAGLSFQQVGTSTNVQIVNGSFSKETTYNFAVSADRAGTFQIPSIKASIDKEEMATPPLSLVVSSDGGPGATGPQPNSNQVPGVAPHSGNGGGGVEPPYVFIERELSNYTPYEGEAIVSTVRIFQRARVVSMVPERDSSPAWRIMSKDGQKTYDTVRDGVHWRVIEVTEVIIPLKSGAIAPPSFALQTTYIQPSKQRIRRGSIWDFLQGGMDMGQEVSKKIASDNKPIQVKPLPTEGRPGTASDMVGDFKLVVDVSKRTLSPSETATVSVRISGRGALDRMADIKMPTLVGARIYPDKPQLKETIEENGLRSSKEYKFAIVPSQPGDHRLGVIELGVFQPATGKWYTLKEDLGILTVTGANGTEVVAPPAVTIATPGQAVVPSPAPDTYHNQKESSEPTALTPYSELGSVSSMTPIKWFGLAVLLIAVLGTVLAVKPMTMRYRAWNTSRIQLRTPYASLKSHLVAQSEPEILALLAKLQELTASPAQDAKALTAKDIAGSLRQNGVPEAIIARLLAALRSVESSMYRGTAMQPAAAAEFVASVQELSTWEKA